MSTDSKKSSKKLFSETVEQLVPFYEREEATQLSKLLFEEILDIPFEHVMIDEALQLSDSSVKQLDAKIELLRKFHPIQYVLGKAHFYGREFFVDSRVLIPRQETEELINEILIDNKKENLKILDIGSGSGCIGITLGLELKNAEITALDIEEGALEVSSKNAQEFGVKLACLRENILLADHLPDSYDIIVSNPPYVTEGERTQMRENVIDHEPHRALFVPDDDPLLFYQKILRLAKQHLTKGGKLYFEINENFGEEVMDLCEKERFTSMRLIRDINGKNRIVKAMID